MSDSEDDFIVDDIIGNKNKKNKKKVNGKNKGSRVERELSKILNKRLQWNKISP